MSSRLLSIGARGLLRSGPSATRAFQTSARRCETAAAAPVLPARKPVGAFRGGYVGPLVTGNSGLPHSLIYNVLRINSLFGFFFGSTLAGSAVYYYVLQEYKTSNELLTGDIYVRLCVYRPCPRHFFTILPDCSRYLTATFKSPSNLPDEAGSLTNCSYRRCSMR